MKRTLSDAIIIGAGLHGCSIALYLARAGVKTIVLEQAYPGRHASGVNAGGVRRLGRHFAEVPLSQAAMEKWWNIVDLVGDDCGFEPSGQVQVAESIEQLESLKSRVEKLQASGFTHEKIINQIELRALAPEIADHCCGAIYCADDGHANPFRTVSAFYAAAQRAGAVFFSNQRVSQIERSQNTWHINTPQHLLEAPLLINCAGAWGHEIARHLGEEVPLLPTALMLMITERLKPFCKPVVGSAGRTLSFKQFENGTVLIGGGYHGYVDSECQQAHVDASQLSINAKTAADLFPIVKNARVVRAWAGIEGVMSDGIPVIGSSMTYPDAYHAFGFSAHGFQLGPITGQIISDLIVHKNSGLPIGDFSIDRFSN
jgi:sarcosine oxidase subunit beta